MFRENHQAVLVNIPDVSMDWFNEKNDTRTSQYVDVKKGYMFSNGLVSDMLCNSKDGKPPWFPNMFCH